MSKRHNFWADIHRWRPSTFLIAFSAAVADLLLGIFFRFGPAHLFRSTSYNVLKRLVPLHLAGWTFIIVGALILVTGFTRAREVWRFAWLAGSMAAAIYAGTFICAVFTGEIAGVPVSPCFFAIVQFAIASDPGNALPR